MVTPGLRADQIAHAMPDTGTLVGILKLLYSQLPGSELEAQHRREAIEVARSLLDARGLDATSLVRFGMAESVLGSLAVWIVLETEINGPYEQTRPYTDLAAWREALQVPPIVVGPKTQKRVSREFLVSEHERIQAPLRTWLENADPDDVMTLKPPTRLSLDSMMVLEEAKPEVRDSYRWLVQRLNSTTAFEDWDKESLRLEFLWKEGRLAPPASAAVMDSVSVNEDKLHYAIASTGLLEDEPDRNAFDGLSAQLQRQAIVFLGQKRHSEAAALFQFYMTMYPDSNVGLNNMAFCSIPSDPEVALHHLKVVEKRGYKPRSVNVYNQMCCHIIQGRLGVALDRAEFYWNREQDSRPVAGSLWLQRDSGWELGSVRDARLELAILARRTAEALGKTARVEVWRQREAAIVGR